MKSEKKYLISLFVNEDEKKDFLISKNILEEILIKNNLIKLLNSLLKNLLNEARGKNCKITDCHSIILVGGGTQIPLIKNWISLKIPGIPINVPPPIESVSIGALSLTPGVKIKDILNKGLSIRLYNKKNKAHFWYPIFVKGQTWPTDNPFELTLQASKNNQRIFEIVIGETNEDNCFDVIFEDGIPKIAEVQAEEMISQWNREPLKIKFQNPSLLGEDCLKLNFCIQKNSHLYLKWNDYLEENEGEFDFGSIY